MARFEKKYTTEEVQQIFSASGCELLESTYKDMLTPMSYICSCGSQSYIRLSAFIKGSRCKQCGISKLKERQKVPFDVIKARFASEGYTLLSSEYINNKIPLEYVCPNGHNSCVAWGNFLKGNRCKKCFIATITGLGNKNYDPDREAVAERLKFRKLCKSLVSRTLKAIGTEKIKRSEELLGYTHQELKDHLKCDIMNWSVDHIFPIKAFVDYGIQDVSIINSLDNLRSLELLDNLKKNDKYDKQMFEEYLLRKGISWK